MFPRLSQVNNAQLPGRQCGLVLARALGPGLVEVGIDHGRFQRNPDVAVLDRQQAAVLADKVGLFGFETGIEHQEQVARHLDEGGTNTQVFESCADQHRQVVAITAPQAQRFARELHVIDLVVAQLGERGIGVDDVTCSCRGQAAEVSHRRYQVFVERPGLRLVTVGDLAHVIAQGVVLGSHERPDHVGVTPNDGVLPVDRHRLGQRNIVFLPVPQVGQAYLDLHASVLVDLEDAVVESSVDRYFTNLLSVQAVDFDDRREVHEFLDLEGKLEISVIGGRDIG